MPQNYNPTLSKWGKFSNFKNGNDEFSGEYKIYNIGFIMEYITFNTKGNFYNSCR